MKPKKLKSPLALNKQTITDLSALEQGRILGGASGVQWTCPVPTQCVPAYVTQCSPNCEPTDYSCVTDCGQYTCGGDTCQVTCDALSEG